MSKASDKRDQRKRERQQNARQKREDRRAYKLAKYSNRNAVVRQTNRTSRTQIRQEGRTNRVVERQTTKRVAFENGINPNEWVGDMVQGLGDNAEGVISGFFGGGGRNKPPRALGIETIEEELGLSENVLGEETASDGTILELIDTNGDGVVDEKRPKNEKKSNVIVYIIGAILVIGTSLLLIFKRKTNNRTKIKNKVKNG
jgi:hypothetical protein